MNGSNKSIDIPAEIKYYGKKELLPQQRVLNAGNLSVVYETGNLRSITYNGTEIIRMIYAAVRDKAWLTINPEIADEFIEDRSDSFHISYNCRYRLNECQWQYYNRNERESAFNLLEKPDRLLCLTSY